MRARDLQNALAMDWGNSSPGCVLWGCALPDGKVHIYDELKFQRQTAKDVAEAVKAKCHEWRLPAVPTVSCDPSLLPAKKGERGEWIGLTLIRYGLPMRRVSNDRINGWQRLHEALAPSPDGLPWLTVHPRCRYLTRTMPLAAQADGNPEDVDTTGDDHGLDAARYLLMGGLRPSVSHVVQADPPPNSWGWWRKFHARLEQPQGVLA